MGASCQRLVFSETTARGQRGLARVSVKMDPTSSSSASSMEQFVQELFAQTKDLGSLTQRIVRQKYLQHTQASGLDSEAKALLKQIVLVHVEDLKNKTQADQKAEDAGDEDAGDEEEEETSEAGKENHTDRHNKHKESAPNDLPTSPSVAAKVKSGRVSPYSYAAERSPLRFSCNKPLPSPAKPKSPGKILKTGSSRIATKSPNAGVGKNRKRKRGYSAEQVREAVLRTPQKSPLKTGCDSPGVVKLELDTKDADQVTSESATTTTPSKNDSTISETAGNSSSKKKKWQRVSSTEVRDALMESDISGISDLDSDSEGQSSEGSPSKLSVGHASESESDFCNKKNKDKTPSKNRKEQIDEEDWKPFTPVKDGQYIQSDSEALPVDTVDDVDSPIKVIKRKNRATKQRNRTTIFISDSDESSEESEESAKKTIFISKTSKTKQKAKTSPVKRSKDKQKTAKLDTENSFSSSELDSEAERSMTKQKSASSKSGSKEEESILKKKKQFSLKKKPEKELSSDPKDGLPLRPPKSAKHTAKTGTPEKTQKKKKVEQKTKQKGRKSAKQAEEGGSDLEAELPSMKPAKKKRASSSGSAKVPIQLDTQEEESELEEDVAQKQADSPIEISNGSDGSSSEDSDAWLGKPSSKRSSPKNKGGRGQNATLDSSDMSSDEDAMLKKKKLSPKVEKTAPQSSSELSESSSTDEDDDGSSKRKAKQKATSKKRKRESSSNDENKPKRQKSNNKEPQDKATRQLKNLERIARACGVMPCGRNIAVMYKGCSRTSQRVTRIKEVLEDAGMKGRPNLKKAEKLKIKKEAEELDKGNIISSQGRGKRRNVFSVYATPQVASPAHSKQHSPPKSAFTRLKGIVISNDSDSE